MFSALITLKALVYLLAGFSWEVLITSYHRCVIEEKNAIASLLAMTITCVSLLIVSNLTKEIILSETGLAVYAYVFVFALGKGAGAFTSLSWWSKKEHKVHDSGDCQRRD